MFTTTQIVHMYNVKSAECLHKLYIFVHMYNVNSAECLHKLYIFVHMYNVNSAELGVLTSLRQSIHAF